MASRLALQLLGTFSVLSGDKALPVAGKKSRGLLAYLAMSPGQLYAREKLATLLWGDRLDKQARQSLRQCVVTLRKELEDLPETAIFIGDREQLGIAYGAIDVDALHFRNAAAAETLEGAQRAITLYRGDLLADLGTDSEDFESWLTEERGRLRGLAEGAFDTVARHFADTGKGDDAIATAQRLLDLDPTQEASHRLLIDLLARFRGPDAALRQYQHCVAVLRRELDATPSQQTLQLIKGIKHQPASTIPITAAATSASRRYGRAAWALAAGAVLAGAVFWTTSERPTNSPPVTAPEAARVLQASLHPTTMRIMVLPFQAYAVPEAMPIADAIADDLTTDLSLIPGVFVIANATAANYRGQAADPRRIGRELDVRYVLSGGVRLVDDEMRINVELIDTHTGGQLWARHFRGTRGQRLALEDEITASLLANLHLELTLVDALRRARERPDSVALDDLLVRGRAARMRGPTPENVREAISIFKQALQIAPDSSWAVSGLAGSYVISVINYQSQDPERDLAEAETLIARALLETPDCFFCWSMNGLILRTRGRFDDAVAAFEHSVKINPNYAYAYAHLGNTLIYLGRAGETGRYVERAMQLSPQDPLLPVWQMMIGRAQLLLGDDLQAVETMRQAASRNPRVAGLYRVLAAGLMLTGDVEGAREAAVRFRALTSGASPVAPEEALARDPIYLGQRTRFSKGLSDAGL